MQTRSHGLRQEYRDKQWVLPNVSLCFGVLFFLFGSGKGGADASPDLVALQVMCIFAACGFGWLYTWREFLFLQPTFADHKAALALRCGLGPAAATVWVAVVYAVLAQNGP